MGRDLGNYLGWMEAEARAANQSMPMAELLEGMLVKHGYSVGAASVGSHHHSSAAWLALANCLLIIEKLQQHPLFSGFCPRLLL